MPDFLSESAWVWTAVLATLGVAFLLCRPVARWLGASRRHAFLLLVSVVGIIVLTLTPTPRIGAPIPYCDIASLRPIAFDQLVSVNLRSLNVLLFVPVGVALGVLPYSRAKAVTIVLAVMAPMAIELVQSTVTALGRACEAIDVVDNLTGLVIGLVLAELRTLAIRARSS